MGLPPSLLGLAFVVMPGHYHLPEGPLEGAQAGLQRGAQGAAFGGRHGAGTCFRFGRRRRRQWKRERELWCHGQGEQLRCPSTQSCVARAVCVRSRLGCALVSNDTWLRGCQRDWPARVKPRIVSPAARRRQGPSSSRSCHRGHRQHHPAPTRGPRGRAVGGRRRCPLQQAKSSDWPASDWRVPQAKPHGPRPPIC
jgi:hypothetical protein